MTLSEEWKMRIAFVHTKGGVGKTTASIMLAAAAYKRGIPIVVYDADPQASASRWAEVADVRNDPLDFEVKRVDAQFLRNLPSGTTGWEIIDTPPGNASEIQAAVDTADLVIVPTHPAPMDLDRVWPTLEAIQHRMVGVLLIGVHERRRLYRETRNLFEDQGVATFYSTVPEREDIKVAFGTNPQQLHTFDDICAEILEIEEES